MNLGDRELGGLARIRLLIGQMNALMLASEAESLAIDPARRARLHLLLSLMGGDRLAVRIAPLAGWNPDFSVFSGRRSGHASGREGMLTDPGGTIRTLMIGPHWFDRPYPHPGPALGVVLHGEPADRALLRFEQTWKRGHDVRGPIESILRDSLEKT